MMILDRKESQKTKLFIYIKKTNSNEVISQKVIKKNICDINIASFNEIRYIR